MGRAVEGFLASAREQATGLLIEGEAGIGKTTMWAGIVDQAGQTGFQVLSARTGQAESGFAHAAVADLFGAVDAAILGGLPDVQRLAADRVLLRDDTAGVPTDERVTAAALLTAVRALSAESPVLIAVDDVQWLDPSSRAVLAFVARRLKGPIGVVVTERSDTGQGEPAASWLQVGPAGTVTRTRVAPMSLGAVHAMLTSRLGRTFSRPVIARIAEVSGGNPLYALELAQAASAGPGTSSNPLPTTLAELVQVRVGRLDKDVRDVLLVAASVTTPTVDLLARAVDQTVEATTGLLEVAEVAGVVVIEGNRVRFTHPLLASGIYDGADPDRRRELHRTLAGIKTQPELRARHLALAATTADEATLQALDAAALSARGRGAPAAAAEFVELAIRLGGDKIPRRIAAAEHHFSAGDTARAAALIEPVLDGMRPGVLRALALNLLAGVRIFEDRYIEARDMLLRACEDAAGVDTVLAATLLPLGFIGGASGSQEFQLATVRQAVTVAERTGVPTLISQALALCIYVSLEQGLGLDQAAMDRALALEDPAGTAPIPFRASATNGLTLAITGRLDEADRQLTKVAERSLERGAENDLMAVTGYRALLACWRGRFAEAERFSAETMERAEQLRGSLVIAHNIAAVTAAHTGRERDARAHASATLEQGAQCGPYMVGWTCAALAFLESSLGNYQEAVRVARPMVSLYGTFPATELWSCWFLPDVAESMIRVRRLDDAEPLIEAFERNGSRLQRAWMLAVGGRCRALLSAARGHMDAALEAVDRALAAHDDLAMPFERARTQLVKGELLRRMRRKDAAVAELQQALAAFEALGTPLWAAKAGKELARLHVVPGAGEGALTATERRIAEMAASGMTNRDMAASLFVSVKTVEMNLTRAYRKLGIRSRARLSQRLAELEELRPG